MPRLARSSKAAVISAAVLTLIVAGFALAQTAVDDKLRTGDSVTVPAGETVPNDLYAFAGTVRIDGTVDGDLVATGGTIDIPGTVTGDVLAAGGNVSITGTVGGDARAAGGTLSVGGSVAEDLAAAGGQVTLSQSATVGEDMLASAGRLTVDGAVTGNLTASTGSYAKSGTVGGTEDVRITAQGPQPVPTAPEQSATGQVIDAIQHFLVVLLAGGLLIWLAPRAYAATKEAIQRRPLPAAGWGLLGMVGYVVVLIAIVIAMVVLAVIFGIVGFDDLVGLDVLGGIVAILGVTLGFVIVCAYLADAIVGAAIVGLFMRGQPSATRAREFGVLALGAAAVVLLSSIPVIGPWVKLVVIVLGLGAVLLVWWSARRPAPPPPVSFAAPIPTTPTTPTTT
jgi:cytoskeletal protein CcmA (bactofilin family)